MLIVFLVLKYNARTFLHVAVVAQQFYWQVSNSMLWYIVNINQSDWYYSILKEREDTKYHVDNIIW